MIWFSRFTIGDRNPNVDELPVEQMRHRAQQVAEQVPRALLRSDVQVHRIELNDQPEHVQVDRPDRQVEDLARAVLRRRPAG